MELKYRRIYAYTCIGLFVIIAPLLILYATGYRYDFDKSEVIRTGVLAVDSNPRGATIILNDRVSRKKTDAVMKNLKPDNYHVTIKKNGYHSWEKTLPVFPNQATLTNRVTLMKKSQPISLLENVTQFQISPNYSTIAYLISDGTHYFLNVAKLSDLSVFKKIEVPDLSNVNFSFSRDNQYLFLSTYQQDNNRQQIVSISKDADPFDLSEITTLNFNILKSETALNGFVYGVANGKLYQIDLIQSSVKLLLNDQLNDFTITADTIYYISQSDSKTQLKQAKLNEQTESQALLTIAPGNYLVDSNSNGLITLLNQNKNNLSLIEPSAGTALKLKQMNATVKGYQWSPDKKKILFHNDYEIWYLDLETEETQLLIRSSEIVESAQWHPNETWIVYIQSNKLKAIELDGRDARNIIELTDQNPIQFQLDANHNKIYFLKREAAENGIYQLDLD